MRILKVRQNKVNYINKGGVANKVVLGKGFDSSIMANINTFVDRFNHFVLLSIPLPDGVYTYKVKSIDNLQNINDGVEVNVTIPPRLWFPKNVTSVLSDTDKIKVSWEQADGGLSPIGYNIYSNNGVGEIVDKSVPLATVANNIFEYEFDSLVDGVWRFIVEAYDNNNESINFFATKITKPVEDEVPPDPNNSGSDDDVSNEFMRNIILTNVSIGKCGIRFVWFGGAVNFLVYHDSATGTIDWNTPKYTFSRVNGIIQEFVTEQLLTEDVDTVFKFGIRAENSAGENDGNTNVYEVLLDGKAPEAVENIQGDLS
jgi:hypothetical protein